jgi:hypothetical protein
VVVGGALAAAGDALLEPVREAIDRYAQPGTARAVAVLPGVLGERAEVLGALALVIGDTDRLRSAGLTAIRETARARRDAHLADVRRPPREVRPMP